MLFRASGHTNPRPTVTKSSRPLATQAVRRGEVSLGIFLEPHSWIALLASACPEVGLLQGALSHSRSSLQGSGVE
jgi:hypothetical protein